MSIASFRVARHSVRPFRYFSTAATSSSGYVRTVTSQEEYEGLKAAAEAPVLVGLFTAKHSLAGKMYASQFPELANKFSNFAFFKCDVDQVPSAAYDAEVVEDFQVAVMPIGMEVSTGRECTKIDWVGVTAERAGGAFNVIKETENILAKLSIAKSQKSKRWEFDPSTGTTTCVVLE